MKLTQKALLGLLSIGSGWMAQNKYNSDHRNFTVALTPALMWIREAAEGFFFPAVFVQLWIILLLSRGAKSFVPFRKLW